MLQGELIDVPDLPVRWITVALDRPANDEVPPDLPVERDFLRWLFRETVKPQARRVPSGPAEVFTTAPSGGSPQRESGIGRARQPRS